MQETLEAVYEDGVFKPLTHPHISEGQRVKIIVEPISDTLIDEVLDLAGKVYEGLTDQEIKEVEKIALKRDNFWGNKKSK